MPALAWGMIVAGVVALVAGLLLVRERFRAAEGAVGKMLVLGPVCEAVALAIFSAEHFGVGRGMVSIVPKWLPGPLFWVYFFGVALGLAAISLIVWLGVRWSALGMTVFFLLIVLMVDLPALPKQVHERLFWTLTLRETVFACGTMVLLGSLWPRRGAVGEVLMRVGRAVMGVIFIVYAFEHFFYPRFVPGVPLEKMTPAWFPAPVALAYVVGLVLLVSGVALLANRMVREAAALSGAVLVALVVFFYTPILLMELHTPLVIEGINYVGDTLLFAGTALLAGFGARES